MNFQNKKSLYCVISTLKRNFLEVVVMLNNACIVSLKFNFRGSFGFALFKYNSLNFYKLLKTSLMPMVTLSKIKKLQFV